MQLSRSVWVLPGRKPRRQVFSWRGSFVVVCPTLTFESWSMSEMTFNLQLHYTVILWFRIINVQKIAKFSLWFVTPVKTFHIFTNSIFEKKNFFLPLFLIRLTSFCSLYVLWRHLTSKQHRPLSGFIQFRTWRNTDRVFVENYLKKQKQKQTIANLFPITFFSVNKTFKILSKF